MDNDKDKFLNVARENGWCVKKLSAKQIKTLTDKELENLPELYMFSKPKTNTPTSSSTSIDNKISTKNYLINFITNCLNLI